MSKEYEILPVVKNKNTGQEIVTIPKKSKLYGARFVKVIMVKE